MGVKRKDGIKNYSEISTLDDWLKDELIIETGNKGGKLDFWSLHNNYSLELADFGLFI